ncbi:membrane protease subunit (stomatin/prohibitin family) [Pseudoalteromonas sp. MBR-15]|jgi:membrane protease subunit (stomatin/prohibitin family)|uniref:hypothetical protein n=1 Tax=Pseudoalteromonas lipolytica TaxID=570156 RepID=UPI003BA1EED2
MIKITALLCILGFALAFAYGLIFGGKIYAKGYKGEGEIKGLNSNNVIMYNQANKRRFQRRDASNLYKQCISTSENEFKPEKGCVVCNNLAKSEAKLCMLKTINFINNRSRL